MPVVKESPKKVVVAGGTSVAPGEGAEEKVTKPGAKEKVAVVANEELVHLLEAYDENVEKAEGSFIAMVEFIQKNQLPRAVVVASMMKARGIGFESADTQYSRMKKLLNNQEVLDELKSGAITLKVAREKTKTPQKNPASAKPEAKEQKFTTSLAAFVAAAKESGYELKAILVSVEAELKSAGIK